MRTYTDVVLTIDLPAGSYGAEWLNTKTGRVEKREEFRHAGGRKSLAAPTYEDDVALSIKAAGRVRTVRAPQSSAPPGRSI